MFAPPCKLTAPPPDEKWKIQLFLQEFYEPTALEMVAPQLAAMLHYGDLHSRKEDHVLTSICDLHERLKAKAEQLEADRVSLQDQARAQGIERGYKIGMKDGISLAFRSQSENSSQQSPADEPRKVTNAEIVEVLGAFQKEHDKVPGRDDAVELVKRAFPGGTGITRDTIKSALNQIDPNRRPGRPKKAATDQPGRTDEN